MKFGGLLTNSVGVLEHLSQTLMGFSHTTAFHTRRLDKKFRSRGGGGGGERRGTHELFLLKII